MKLLALDTSSDACSVAVCDDEQVWLRHEEQAREHTRLLMPMIREVLAESSLSLAELDAIVLGNGPGSFIGMRIAASVAQGLAHGAGVGVVPVSSLAAVAAEVFAVSDAEQVVVAQDAHMNEVYLGMYARGTAGVPQALIPERLQPCEAIVELQTTGAHSVYAGRGWQRYAALLAANCELLSTAVDVEVPRASYLLTMAALDKALPPEAVEPAYLRETVAQKPKP